MKTLLAGAQILKLEKIVQMSGAITLFVGSVCESSFAPTQNAISAFSVSNCPKSSVATLIALID
jgi:hypothetical protein